MNPLLRVAWISGSVPILVGTAIFILWLIFRTENLMAAGLFTIFAGLFCVVVGLVCLASYVWSNWHSPVIPRRRLKWQAAAMIALFIANFLAAGGYVSGAIKIQTRYSLSITNQGKEILRGARVDGGGIGVQYGDIAPGQTVQRGFWIEQDGSLVLTATQGGKKVEATVDGYVTASMGGDTDVKVDGAGEVLVIRD